MKAKNPVALTQTEYKILLAIPRSRSYAEISRTSGVSISYVSRKMEELYGRGFRVRGVFDLQALGLSEITILSEFDSEIYSPPSSVKIPYILRMARVWRGKKPLLFIYAAVPQGMEETFSDILGLEGVLRRVEMTTRWRIDTGVLTRLRDGVPASDYKRLPEVIGEVEPYEPSANESRVPDTIDTWLIATLTKNPYVKLASILDEIGVKQQIASYHLSRHVQHFLLYNVVHIKGRAKPPYRLIIVKPAKGEEKRVAKALVQAPAIYEAHVLEDGGVAALLRTGKEEEYWLYRALTDLDLIEDYEDVGLVLEEPKAYTTPYGDVVAEKTWTLDPLYMAMRAVRRKSDKVNYNFGVYELD